MSSITNDEVLYLLQQLEKHARPSCWRSWTRLIKENAENTALSRSKTFSIRKKGGRKSKSSVIVRSDLVNEAVIISPNTGRFNFQQYLYRSRLRTLVVAVNKASPVVAEFRLFVRYEVNATHG